MQMKISADRMLAGKTEVDNSFLLNFMPFAPESYVKVYLAGLLAASCGTGDDNAEEYIAGKLNIDLPVVEEAFRYWETQGVVTVVRSVTPPEIQFLPVGKAMPSASKFSKTKYKDFNDQLHAMLPGRNILPGEYNEYYSLMEDTHMEPNGMLAIIAYCIRQKGENITYPYILAVARNLAGQGLLTFDRISEQLSEFDAYEKELRPVLSALGSKRKSDHEDKRLYIKWTKGMEYTPATVIKVAKTVKKGGMEKLDAMMTRYYENHLMTFEEIEDFNRNREKLVALTKNINRIIGVYYEQLDFYNRNVYHALDRLRFRRQHSHSYRNVLFQTRRANAGRHERRCGKVLQTRAYFRRKHRPIYRQKRGKRQLHQGVFRRGGHYSQRYLP